MKRKAKNFPPPWHPQPFPYSFDWCSHNAEPNEIHGTMSQSTPGLGLSWQEKLHMWHHTKFTLGNQS